jgi:hypothetical protein
MRVVYTANCTKLELGVHKRREVIKTQLEILITSSTPTSSHNVSFSLLYSKQYFTFLCPPVWIRLPPINTHVYIPAIVIYVLV